MKLLIAISALAGFLFALSFKQQPPIRPELNVTEIVGQLGLCNANLNVEQRYTNALKAENEALRKKVADLEKKNTVPSLPKPSE